MAQVSDLIARRSAPGGPPDQASILAALAVPLFVIDDADCFSFVNQAAEQFFDSSTSNPAGRPLGDLLPDDSPIFGLIRQVRESNYSVADYGVTLAGAKTGSHLDRKSTRLTSS